MKSKVALFVIFLTLISWPFNLFLANTKTDFIRYLIPLVILGIGYFLWTKKKDYFLLPILAIPFFEPKLALFPILFIGIDFFYKKNLKKYLIFFAISIIVLALVWRPFKGQTIFTLDYQARQQVLRNITLYPNPISARMFQNKAKIYYDKFISNLFALTDPNNYFFGFHPREITVTNQNLDKYPFLEVVFALIGIFVLGKSRNKEFIITSFVSLIISLSVLNSFDRNDFILWLPISLLLVEGIKYFFGLRNKNVVYIFSTVFILFCLIQFLSNYINFMT
ncbi:hypothetical protein MUP46_02955 [Patescibacteria group bacterium]|nr:hypothetical protein [Patescibacteria group bacterium]